MPNLEGCIAAERSGRPSNPWLNPPGKVAEVVPRSLPFAFRPVKRFDVSGESEFCVKRRGELLSRASMPVR